MTVQRRIVFVEGCVADKRQFGAIDAWAKGVADVEQVVVNVTTAGVRSSYRLLDAAPSVSRPVSPVRP